MMVVLASFRPATSISMPSRRNFKTARSTALVSVRSQMWARLASMHTRFRGSLKSNAALMKPLQPSTELAAVVGSSALPRTEVVSKVWEYIKAHNLQNPENKREILADEKLRAIFGGKDKVSMFEMNKHFAQHLS
jgi:chromatin remodeling complex protein RSC6